VSTVNPQSDNPIPGVEYQSELMALLLRELLKGPVEFAKIVKDAEGAYPSEVMSALRLLEAEERVSFSESGLWQVDHRSNVTPSTNPTNIETTTVSKYLPEPHPLDFDWRFTEETLLSLRTLLRFARLESIAILGAPTLYKYLVDSAANAWLYDKNPSVIRYLQTEGYDSVTECDLLKYEATSKQFQWVFADPPWYVEYYEAFLRAACGLLVPGGHLLLSMLPRLTRPLASTHRLHIIKYAAGLGFDLIELERGALGYESPPFEVEALRAEGIAIENWRSGDLFSFVLRSHDLGPDSPAEPEASASWTTIELGSTTIRIKNDHESQTEKFTYEPVSESGDTRLHSVSRRSPSRSRINLWTSRNVALVVSKRETLVDALLRVRNGKSMAEVLSGVSDKYQLADFEVKSLKDVIDLLLADAGLL
jgi:hypothetical protein